MLFLRSHGRAMGLIFINYRREDSSSTAGRLHDRLALAFGRETIFMDVDHIPAGVDFVEHLNSIVAACKVFLVVIGPNWLNAKDEAGQRRLEKPDDWVAVEIEGALVRKIRVIPVLVDGADMPKPSELPASLKPLARRQGVEVRHKHFGRDADALIEKVRDALGGSVWRQFRKMAVPIAIAALLLGGSIALFRIWAPFTIETIVPREVQAAANAEAAEQQRVAAAKAKEERRAKAAAEAEAKRESQEAEQQRLAAAKAEEERKTTQEAQLAGLPAAGFSIINDVGVEGEDYLRIGDATVESCSSACIKDAQCKMFAYWPTRVCYLFDKNFGTYPQATSQVGLVRVSPTPAQQRPPAAGFSIIKNVAVNGDDYLRIRNATVESCSSACVEDAQCKMFAYWATVTPRVCYLFDKKFGTYPQATSQVGLVR